MKKQPLYVIIISLLIFCACKQQHFYNKYKAVDVKKWSSSDTLSYAVEIKDDAKNYEYALSVRYQKEYEFSNVWLKVFIQGNGIDTAFRYEIPLFKNDGKPYGKVSGSLCTQIIPLKTTLPLSKKGNYTFKIVQLMRKDPLDGISDIGVIIDKK